MVIIRSSKKKRPIWVKEKEFVAKFNIFNLEPMLSQHFKKTITITMTQHKIKVPIMNIKVC